MAVTDEEILVAVKRVRRARIEHDEAEAGKKATKALALNHERNAQEKSDALFEAQQDLEKLIRSSC